MSGISNIHKIFIKYFIKVTQLYIIGLILDNIVLIYINKTH